MLFLVKKKGKKDEEGDLEATCIPQADISPSTDVTSLFCLASFLYFKEVKQKPVIVLSQTRPADDEEETRAL